MVTTRLPAARPRRFRVLVVEPLELVREGIHGVLAAEEDMLVLAAADPDVRSLSRAREFTPDVALVDFDSAGAESREFLRRLALNLPGMPLVALAQEPDLENLLTAVRLGARGYLLKSVGGTALAQAIRGMGRGGSVIDPIVARRLLDYVASQPFLPALRHDVLDRAAGSLRLLSTREAQVLHSLAQGLSNKEIAAALGLSVGTVKTHLRHIFRKLGVSDRTSAAVAVLRGSASS
jgi:DNA-binding NarL/FixJ family response regulator